MKDVSSVELTQRLVADNPWWQAGAISAFFAEFGPRPYLELLYPFVTQRELNRAVVLLGPRRAGKTVLLHHVIQRLLEEGVPADEILYASADHPLFANASPEDILKLYAQYRSKPAGTIPQFFFLDEAQYIKDWERYLKYLVDRNPQARFVVSGSAAAALRLKSIESGAGRFRDFLLPPLTFHEYLMMMGIELSEVRDFNAPFIDYINYGGYPEISLAPPSVKRSAQYIKTDIIDKVLLRDLPSLYGVRDVQELYRLFTTLAYNTGGEVSLDGLSKGSGVSKKTIKDYIEYLEAAFLIKTVHRIDRSGRHFQRANFFKVYLTNASMYTALFGEIDAESEKMGALVETAIFAQMFHDLGRRFSYARWGNGEVDVVETDGSGKVTEACEIKWSNRFSENPQELTRLVDFCHTHNLGSAIVTTRSSTRICTFKNISFLFMPAAHWCASLGQVMLARKHTQQSPLGIVHEEFNERLQGG